MEPVDLIRIEGKLDRIIEILEYRERLAILEGNMPALVKAISDGFKAVQVAKVHKNTVRSSVDRDVRWRRDSFKRRRQPRGSNRRWTRDVPRKQR